MTNACRAGTGKKTSFTYAKDREFGPGLRAGGLYADLGLAEGTGGNFHAHIIKVNPEAHGAEGTTGMHRHDYDLQFNYVLSGEIDLVIEGIEEKLTLPGGRHLLSTAPDPSQRDPGL